MNNLITLHTQVIAGTAEETVSARELHAFLGSKQDFSTWIKARIEDYGFQERHDFVKVKDQAPQKMERKNQALMKIGLFALNITSP